MPFHDSMGLLTMEAVLVYRLVGASGKDSVPSVLFCAVPTAGCCSQPLHGTSLQNYRSHSELGNLVLGTCTLMPFSVADRNRSSAHDTCGKLDPTSMRLMAKDTPCDEPVAATGILSSGPSVGAPKRPMPRSDGVHRPRDALRSRRD